MPKVKAFQGIRYNKDVVNIAAALCPPYDVIAPPQVEPFYKKAPYNAIRLVLGKQFPKDTKTDNRYTRARDFLKQWRKEAILIKDEKPSLYVHEQIYTVGDKTVTRRGIVASVCLDDGDDSDILPHEYTHKGPKIDRLRLLNEVATSLSCIFGIYSDKDRLVENQIKPVLGEPLWEISTPEGQQRFWKIDSPKLIKQFTNLMIDKTILIADGHHRYETYKTYRDRQRALTGKMDGKQPFDYTMMYLCNMEEGLTICPTHRVVLDGMGVGLVDIEYRIKDLFNMHPYDNRKAFLEAMRKGGKGRIGLRVGGIPRYYLLELIEPDALDKFLPGDMPTPLKRLDVVILHACILEPIFGIDAGLSAKRITFTSNAGEALEMVEKDKADIAFLLNPSSVQEIMEIAQAGVRMPQKSTYFYPKIPTGLVFMALEQGG
ncbi:MAG: DUF1015 domain-containing protein [Syntrophaceae bacterium]